MASDLQKEMRLGNLLIQLEMLNQTDLSEATQLAIELGLPLGKVLIMSGFVSDEQLQMIAKAQAMIKDKIITVEIARLALKLTSHRKISWEAALTEAGWQQPDLIPTHKLGSLLVDVGIITRDELESSLEHATQSKLPLGRVLLLTRLVGESLLCSCLNAQVLLRDGKINREQAISSLKAAQQRQHSVEQALKEHGFYRPPLKARIKLGELLVLSGILTEENIMDAIENGLINDEPLGQVLLKMNLITLPLLDASLKLQQMVDNGVLTPINSAEVLKQINTRGLTIPQAVAELGLKKESAKNSTSVADLLKQAGILNEDDIQEAFRQTMQNSSLLGKILTITGMLNEDTLEAAVRCQSMVKQGQLTEDKAIVALNYCQHMQRTLDEALSDLGWTQQGNESPV